MSLHVAADAERIASTYLRSVPEVAALVGSRVYTEMPKRSRAWPLVRLVRVGGGQVTTPAHLDAATLQVDVWGGSKFEARQAAATVAAAFEALNQAAYAMHDGVVTGAAVGAFRYDLDNDFEPGRPRYLFDVTFYTHPAQPVPEIN